MASKKPKKAQSSLEYLITYGWALVMIATIIGVLVFATGGINTNTCTTFLTMICKGVGADGDTLILVLQNTTGQKITINPFIDIRFDDKEGYAIVTYQGKDYRFDDVTISAGDEFTISAKGMALAAEVSITYTEKATGITRTVTSGLSTDAPTTIELSNDGLDNDGDGLVDCLDPDATDCEYVVEANPFAPSITVTNATWEIVPFGTVKGSSGMNLTGDWTASDSVILVFYVETFTAGTTADVQFAMQTTSVDLVQGWNTAEISLPSPHTLMGANISDFRIISNGADFTIANEPLPKAILIVNPL